MNGMFPPGFQNVKCIAKSKAQKIAGCIATSIRASGDAFILGF
jgi:hypothetical protein